MSSAPRERRRAQPDVVGAALRVIERDGFDALSMRRVAAELDVGTMTLYHYVANKNELIRRMADHIGKELLLDEVPADWKQALREIARASRAAILRHPWVFTVDWDESLISASFVGHIDQSLQAVSGLDVDRETRDAILRSVDDFTFGNAYDTQREMQQARVQQSFPIDELREVAEAHGYAEVAKTLEEYDGYPRSEDHFERGLEWLLAGIEASLTR